MLPQSLSSRPFVISSEQSVYLELFEGPNESAKICVDGQDDIDTRYQTKNQEDIFEDSVLWKAGLEWTIVNGNLTVGL